ncbi:MAG TPA: hydroxymethylbilane synthase [Candidatus Acutalibacter stercorigallinarum]|nr:hydroxymethylbilane synthase [Candidatus Acutalibacter stercorigallinarum]
MKKLVVGSRESRLAVIQTQLAIQAIRACQPGLEVELLTMKTTGDKILDRTLDQVGGKGLFVKELDAALLAGRVDLTVHSSKDLPMETDPRLPLVAFSRRADPRDALVLPAGAKELDPAKPIGCSSLRRQLQLKALFPQMKTAPVRGNVLTRLEKLDRGEYAALVLAAAGLERLGLAGRVSRYFSVEEMLPAAGQGILAVQARADFDPACLREFHDPESRDCLLAERAFVRALDGGCSSPVAAYATVDGEALTLTGLYVDSNGEACRQTISGPRGQGERLGAALAQDMRREHP